MTLEGLSGQISNLDTKFDSLEAKVEDGFNASEIREDEILGVARLGLEAKGEVYQGEIQDLGASIAAAEPTASPILTRRSRATGEGAIDRWLRQAPCRS